MKTSTGISLKFTVFTIGVVIFFGVATNVMFFRSWYQSSVNFLKKPHPNSAQMQKILGRERGPMLDMFQLDSFESEQVLKNIVWKNIANVDDRYFLFVQKKHFLVLTDVTHAIDAQKTLLWSAVYLLVVFAFLAYILSLLFVKTALKRLNLLVDFAKDIHLDRLENKINIEGSTDDEINILAQALNRALAVLHQQAFALKDFVAHASHELKTPLMAISSEIDLATKTKDFSHLEKVKTYLKSTNALIEQLLLIAKLESNQHLDIKKHKVKEIVYRVFAMIEKKYVDKHLQWNLKVEDVDWLCHLPSFELILQNLLDNAGKYSNQSGTVDFMLDAKGLSVKDDGVGMEKQHLGRVRDRFWQEEQSRSGKKGFGLGLFLVKKLVEKHGWSIEVESEKGKGFFVKVKSGGFPSLRMKGSNLWGIKG